MACSAIFLAANILALNCCSVSSKPFLPTNTCFTVGSFSAAICPKLEGATGTSLHPKISRFWFFIAVSKVVLQKATWLMLLGIKTIPTAYCLTSGSSKSHTFLKKS